MKKEILSKLGNIKLFLFDLEGVLLHNGDSNDFLIGEVKGAAEKFSKLNLNFGIVTAREEDELIKELQKIEGCVVMHSSLEKVAVVAELIKKLSIDCSNVFYIGDGVLDIPLLQKCGLSAAPMNAKRDVKRVVDITMLSDNAMVLFKEIFTMIEKLKNK